jgi:hypothetical protein
MRFFPWNSAVAYSAAVLADSPVGYWRLGESSGTTMSDSSGNGHDGTYVNTPTLGQTGAVPGNTSVLFEANTFERGEVSNRPELDITGALTLEAWANCVSYGGRGIVAKYIGAGDLRSYHLAINSAGNIAFNISSDGTAANTKSVITSGAIGLNTWRHVAAVYTPSTGMEVFLDGVSAILDTTAVPASIYSGSAVLHIGRTFDGLRDRHWDGLLDECAVYNTALSSARIAAHYAARNTA